MDGRHFKNPIQAPHAWNRRLPQQNRHEPDLWKVARLLASQDAIDIGCSATEKIGRIGSVTPARELLPFYKPKLSAVATQDMTPTKVTVIRAPEIETDGASWLAKYGPKDEPKALESPTELEQAIVAKAEELEERRQAAAGGTEIVEELWDRR